MANKELNELGLREYSFEIGPMDDSDITVAIVGEEYSSVDEDEKFYRKEEVDELVSKLKEQISTERSSKVDYHISANDLSDGLAKAYAENKRLNRALYKALANWALSTLAWLDCIDQGNPAKWSEMRQKCLAKVEVYK